MRRRDASSSPHHHSLAPLLFLKWIPSPSLGLAPFLLIDTSLTILAQYTIYNAICIISIVSTCFDQTSFGIFILSFLRLDMKRGQDYFIFASVIFNLSRLKPHQTYLILGGVVHSGVSQLLIASKLAKLHC